MYKKIILIFALFFILTINNIIKADDKVTFEAYPSKLEISKGEEFKIKFIMNFKSPWYTYDFKEQLNPEGIGPTPTEITVAPKEKVEIFGKIIAPEPKTKYDEGFEMNIKHFEGKVEVTIPVKAKTDLNLNNDKINVVTYLQLCDSTKCLPPEEFITEVKPEIIEVSNGSIFSFLWVAISAGALALLTPCVFPMVPITVSFFTKRAEVAKGKGLRDALVYAFGIIITFTALGFLFSILFGASGIQEFSKSPGVYLFIALIFLLFAFNLFGAYEIQMPTGLMNKLNTKSQQGSGIGSVILMGLTFSLASFSCTGPLVGAALIAAASGEWFYPILSMVFFSATMALPFFFLALFPSMLSALPKAGGWMNNMKVVLGFIVLATSLYFINNAIIQWGGGLSRELFLSIWVGIFLLTTLYIVGVFKMESDSPIESVGSVRIIFALIFATLTLYLLSGLFGADLGEFETYVPQSENPIALSSFSTMSKIGPVKMEDDIWNENYNEALALAKEQQKPIFIDFTGKTCTNCKKMERKIFPRPKVKELLDKYIKVRLITDINKEPYLSNKKLQLEKFNSVAIPLYVIMSPNAEVIATEVYNDSEEEFIAFLKKGL